jgi:CrcB protein
MPGPDRRELAAVFAGGARGTLARAAIASLVPVEAARWPWPTFAVNVVGAFLLGYFTTRLLERQPLSSYRRSLLGTGLCGGLTTFSTMQVETLQMIEHHHYLLASVYAAVSVAAGLGAVSPNVRLLAGTAAVGSYTTFSTWTLETHRSARNPSGGSPPSTSSPASCL